MLQVEVIETSELGDRSYIAHDGSTAVVIDPQRDIDRVQVLLREYGLRVAAVAETHIHNDYVTGGLELARVTGAPYLVNADDDVAFERRPVTDGEEMTYGSLVVQVIATPGHTHNHVAYAISTSDAPDDQVAVFTGGSLLYGSVGRTDLLGSEQSDALARAQFQSARKLVAMLPGQAGVFPTHGFGSFCSSGSAAGGESSTLGQEEERNDALTEPDEDTFVQRLLANLTAYPAYYAHMTARNSAGPGPADLSPAKPVDAEQLRKHVEAGDWVVDLRDRKLYSAAHLPGTIGIELGQQFATYLGWLIPWGTPLTLIGESQSQIADAQRQLVRIGIERPDGAAVGAIASLADGQELGTYRRATFTQLQARLADETSDTSSHSGAPASGDVVLDVRRDDERSDAQIPGSAHIPMHALLDRLDEVPDGTLWVHCASGFRASIAASLLARTGHQVVLVDDEFDQAQQLGMTN